MTSAKKSGWFVYLVRCNDDSCYCGVTTNIEKRLAQHNGLLPGGAKYTGGRRPVTLIGCALCENRSDALKKERKIKSWPASRKIAFFRMATPSRQNEDVAIMPCQAL